MHLFSPDFLFFAWLAEHRNALLFLCSVCRIWRRYFIDFKDLFEKILARVSVFEWVARMILCNRVCFRWTRCFRFLDCICHRHYIHWGTPLFWCGHLIISWWRFDSLRICLGIWRSILGIEILSDSNNRNRRTWIHFCTLCIKTLLYSIFSQLSKDAILFLCTQLSNGGNFDTQFAWIWATSLYSSCKTTFCTQGIPMGQTPYYGIWGMWTHLGNPLSLLDTLCLSFGLGRLWLNPLLLCQLYIL